MRTNLASTVLEGCSPIREMDVADPPQAFGAGALFFDLNPLISENTTGLPEGKPEMLRLPPVIGGADGTRTRDLRRDRPAF